MILIAALVMLRIGPPNNIYTQFVEKLRSAEEVSGRTTFTEETPHGHTEAVDVFRFQKPNLYRSENWIRSRLYRLEVGDGTTCWSYDAIENRVGHQKSSPNSFLDNEILLQPFENPGPDEFVAANEPAVKTVFHGKSLVKVNVFRAGTGPTQDLTLAVYMDDQTGLPYAFTYHSAKRDVSFEVVFNQFDIGPRVDPAAFHFDPKIATENPTADTMLLPLGAHAPDFRGALLGGAPFDFAKASAGAKVVILDFWGVGCTPCKQELVELSKLQDLYANKGLKVITVDLFDDEHNLESYQKRVGLKLPVFLVRSSKSDLVYDYKATSEPTTYVIDSNGVIVGHYADSDLAPIKKDLAKLGF